MKMLSEKYAAECIAAGFEYVGKSSRKDYSMVKCMTCGADDEFAQHHIRAGRVQCKHCHETKLINECLAEGFGYLGKSSRVGYSVTKCMTCGTVDEFAQYSIRTGRVRCGACKITKYKSAAKDGWTFDGHYCVDRQTYVNLKHSCSDNVVKVRVGAYLDCSYDCPICMHTHYDDPSFFYVIQVGDIIKLGISNRPDQRYTQYGLPDDSTITEHIRIPLETKRDALVVESYAKQLVKDYKIPSTLAKHVFTKEGFNECYSIDSLDLLLTI